MSLLTIIQRAAVACGLPSPTSVVGNTDPNIQQMLGMAQDEGDESSGYANWRNLKINFNFTGDGSTTLFALPSDFERWPADPAFFAASYPLAPLVGPISDEALLALKAIPAVIWPPVWNMIGGQLQVWPALDAGDVVSGQYRSNFWILSGVDNATHLPLWATDADKALIPETIIRMGVIWRWKRAKGLDFGTFQDDWSNMRDRLAGDDRGMRITRTSNAMVGPSTYPGSISDNSDAGTSGQFA